MRIAVEGCCHGELDKIYDTVTELQRQKSSKIDLLIICGDFQAVRNFDDLQAMAVPPKYQQLNTFYKYYSGEKEAPVLTVFIGGNHEASNYMQELSYGGWVAPKIYYMGYAGVIQVGGVRIGGISGIYKGQDYNKGHFERPPYGKDTIRSVYHVRNLEVFRLKQISRHTDIFVSHDWPKGIYHHGDTATLLKRKPFFRQEVEENRLGAQPLRDLLQHLQPSYWFAAHLHVKFAAHVQHEPSNGIAKSTKFLSLDKCLPHRHFLQVLEIPHKTEEGLKIKLDPEWLSILKSTNHLFKLSRSNVYMPGPGGAERYNFSVTEAEMQQTVETFGGDLTLPENFATTSEPLMGTPSQKMRYAARQPLKVQVNPQTTLLCAMLDLTDPNAQFLGLSSHQLLNQSSVSPTGSGGSDDVASNDDDDATNESGLELPSMIDSSIDMSASLNESGCDSFHTARESIGQSSLSLPSPACSTQVSGAKGDHQTDLPKVSSSNNDEDEEFLSILSAQKRKSGQAVDLDLVADSGSAGSNTSLSSAPCSAKTPEGVCDATDKSGGEARLGIPKPSSLQSSPTLLPQPQSSSSLSPKNQTQDSSMTKPSVRSESSLGMSGLHLSSSSSSPSSSPAVKRASPAASRDSDLASNTAELSSSELSNSEPSPTVKRLKRRNVSMYTESNE